jgi:uncharacterized SAM-binding protein YcdF (DUF218 family)
VFWLKKAVSFWLMPLPFAAALLVAGVVLLGTSRRTLGRWLATAGVGVLLLFSTNRFSIGLLEPLEVRYSAIPELVAGAPLPPALARCRLVVVLGSGHTPMAGVAATAQLSPSGLGRLTEGVRLLRLLPEARLVVSGPADPGERSHAAVLAAAATALGVDPRRITLLETALDTEDESRAIARIAAGQPVALVTSAWHMPRAMRLFRKAGVDALPCPADYIARGDGKFRWLALRFDTESLERSTLAVHEWIGMCWLRLREAL